MSVAMEDSLPTPETRPMSKSFFERASERCNSGHIPAWQNPKPPCPDCLNAVNKEDLQKRECACDGEHHCKAAWEQMNDFAGSLRRQLEEKEDQFHSDGAISSECWALLDTAGLVHDISHENMAACVRRAVEKLTTKDQELAGLREDGRRLDWWFSSKSDGYRIRQHNQKWVLLDALLQTSVECSTFREAIDAAIKAAEKIGGGG